VTRIVEMLIAINALAGVATFLGARALVRRNVLRRFIGVPKHNDKRPPPPPEGGSGGQIESGR
jgi:hypothetical protein